MQGKRTTVIILTNRSYLLSAFVIVGDVNETNGKKLAAELPE